MHYRASERHPKSDSLMEESSIELTTMKTREAACPPKVVVVGGTGHGKSSVINTVMGEDKCAVGVTWAVDKTITSEVQEVDFTGQDGRIIFIDTPSLKTLQSNARFQNLYKNGFQAIVIVYSIKAFTQSRPSVLELVNNLFGDGLKDYALVVLTFEDYLEDATLQEFLNTNKELKDFLQKTGVEAVTMCNTAEKNSPKATEQRNSFFSHLDVIRKRNVSPLSKKTPKISVRRVLCIAGVVLTVVIVVSIVIHFSV